MKRHIELNIGIFLVFLPLLLSAQGRDAEPESATQSTTPNQVDRAVGEGFGATAGPPGRKRPYQDAGGRTPRKYLRRVGRQGS